jgi:hypothetical protein
MRGEDSLPPEPCAVRCLVLCLNGNTVTRRLRADEEKITRQLVERMEDESAFYVAGLHVRPNALLGFEFRDPAPDRQAEMLNLLRRLVPPAEPWEQD